MPSLILASRSPARAALLKRLALPFEQQASDIDETPLKGETPVQLTERLSYQKAQALAPRFKSHLVIASDQVAEFEGEIIGKPHTRDNACRRLADFSGRRVRFHTGLALLDAKSGRCLTHVEPYAVQFRALTRAEIEAYMDLESPLDSAGGFYVEKLGITLFESLEGRDPNALIGLPMIALCHFLREMGVNPLLARR